MPIGGLGAFAGGIGAGLEQGQRIRQRQMELADLQKAQQALKIRADAAVADMRDAMTQAAQAPPPATAQPSGPNLGPPAQPTIGDSGPAGPPGPPMGGAGSGGGLGALQAAQGGSANPMAPAVQNPAPTGTSPPQGGMTPPTTGTPTQPPQTPPSGGSGASTPPDPSMPDYLAEAQKNSGQLFKAYQGIKAQAKQDFTEQYKHMFMAAKAKSRGGKVDPVAVLMATEAQVKADDAIDPVMKEVMLTQSRETIASLNFAKSMYGTERRAEQGDRRLADQEAKTAWYEKYSNANQAERKAMDTWRQTHGDEQQHDLEGFRSWQETHGNTMAGIAQGRLNKAPDNSAGGGAGNARVARILNGNPVGKNYLQAHTFKNQIDALADDPGTATNPAAQLDLIDAAVRQASGGVARKAQFDAIAKRNGFTDLLAMHSFLADGRGIVGPKLIEDIRKSADEQADAAMAAGRKMFPSETAQLEGRGAPASGGGQPGSSHENPVKPKTKQEASALPSGTWFMDPAGNVIQRK